MEPLTGVSQQIYKMRNQAFRILYDTLLESMGLSDDELYNTLCLNLRRISNAKFAALTIIDARTREPIVSYGAYDEDMLPTCKKLVLKNNNPFKIEMIHKCKIAQVRKCVEDEVCFLKYYADEVQTLASGKGECVGISCIHGKTLYAAGLIKMPDGLPLKMTDMVDNYLNLVSMLLSRIQASRELGKSNHEMHRILSTIKNVLILIDENENVIHWNHTAEMLLGKKAESVWGHSLETVSQVWDWKMLKQGLVESKMTNETVVVADVPYRSASEQDGMLNVTFFPGADEHGIMVILGEDVTQCRREQEKGAEIDQTKIVSELTMSMTNNLLNCNKDLTEQVGKLAEIVSSEEKKIVFDTEGRIRNESETGGDRHFYTGCDADKIIGHLQSALSRSRKMLHVVKTIVKPDAHAETEVNLNAALESAIGLTTTEWETVAKLERNMQSDLPLYRCRAGEMNSVFVNLIRNAMQAIEAKDNPGGKKGTITVTSEVTGMGLLIGVEDDGEGVLSSEREAIFKPFYTTRKQCGNIGQGLYIARLYVQKYEGDVVLAKSEKAKTRFEVLLPNRGVGEVPVRLE